MDIYVSKTAKAALAPEFNVYHSKKRIFFFAFIGLFILSLFLLILTGIILSKKEIELNATVLFGFGFFVAMILLALLVLWKFLSCLFKMRQPVLTITGDGILCHDGRFAPWSNITKSNFYIQTVSGFTAGTSIVLTLREGKPMRINMSTTALSSAVYFEMCNLYSR